MGIILPKPFTTDELLSWIDPYGVEWPMNGDRMLFLDGRKGFGMPPQVTTSAQVPLEHGEVPRFTLNAKRPLEIPVLIKGTSRADFRQYIRSLSGAFDATAGAKGQGTSGYFHCTAPDNSTRIVYARYQSGLEYDESNVYTELETVLTFMAYDPFFYDADYTAITTVSAAGAVAFFPILPLNISPDGAIGGFSIINDGQAVAYPIITITGAGDNPALTNNTTGAVMSLTVSLADGDVLVIDTQLKTVALNGSLNFALLDDGSALWTLAQGNNNISVAMTSTDTQSQIQVQYRRRWLGA